jgi:hypothetical protein
MYGFGMRAGNERGFVQLCGYRGLVVIRSINLGQQILGFHLSLEVCKLVTNKIILI